MSLMQAYRLMSNLCIAMYGFVPDYATTSASNYAFYFGSPLVIKRDRNTYRKASNLLISRKLGWFVAYVFILGMYQSFLSLYAFYMPFGNTPTTSEELYSLTRILSANQMGNNLCHAGMKMDLVLCNC